MNWPTAPAWLTSAFTVLIVTAVLRWVDLAPRVEVDFFFSPDDPQLQASQEMSRRFPAPELVVVRVAGESVTADAYVETVRSLTEQLGDVTGVAAVNSITTEDAQRSPLWGPILLNEDGRSSNVVLQVSDVDPEAFVADLDQVLEAAQNADVEIQVSGVPYVVELIRRNLLRDLIVFSSAALVLFGLIIFVVYRRAWLVVGTISTCLLAISGTLALATAVGLRIGLLTANIAVIVFVLTLSHTVFLAANWKRARLKRNVTPTQSAIRETITPSFWCMTTTFLGFSSLLVASAKPLRELGMTGALGTAIALVVAYGMFPVFLKAEGIEGIEGIDGIDRIEGIEGIERRRRSWMAVAGLGVVVLLGALGLPRMSTDPSLLSYFDPDGPLYGGLAAIDRDGGSSPLNLAIRDSDGRTLDQDPVVERMWRLHEALENDSAVGVVISPALLLSEARTAPLAGLLSNAMLIDLLQGPLLGSVGLGFITPDNDQGRFFLRMREADRRESRQATVDRMVEHARSADLDVTLVGGQYEMQAQLGRLIASSLTIGLTALIVLFVGIAAIVSRDLRTTTVMVSCLIAIPVTVLGLMGHLRMPVDIIASPAANVALAMGVDSMIHLVIRARRLRQGSLGLAFVWTQARDQLWPPIVGAAAIISIGFGIFGLSTFPPTQRFGVAVIVGTVMAATLTLFVLPAGVTVLGPRSER